MSNGKTNIAFDVKRVGSHIEGMTNAASLESFYMMALETANLDGHKASIAFSENGVTIHVIKLNSEVVMMTCRVECMRRGKPHFELTIRTALQRPEFTKLRYEFI